MSKAIPEDIRTALENWRLIDDKILSPFRRLGDVLRICADVHERSAQIEQRVASLTDQLTAGQQQLDSQQAASEALRAAILEQTNIKNALTQELATLTARLQAAKRALADIQQMKV